MSDIRGFFFGLGQAQPRERFGHPDAFRITASGRSVRGATEMGESVGVGKHARDNGRQGVGIVFLNWTRRLTPGRSARGWSKAS